MSHKFSNGDHVVMVEKGVHRNGIIRSVIDEVYPPILLVKFEDSDEYEKVTIDKVVCASDNECLNAREQKDRKSEITITPEEFSKIAIKVASKICDGNLTVGMAFVVYAGELHKALFGVESDDD